MEQKQIFSIRKFKTGTHSALLGKIALGSAAILASAALAQGVSADETTTALTTNATAVTVQATDNTANKALESQANTSQGSITQPVTSETLNAAVNDAKAQGVDVSEGDKVSHDTLDSAKEDLSKQEAEVKSATKEKEDNTDEIKKAEATNAQIKADNQAEKERVAKVNVQGQAAVDQRNAQGQAQINQINANEKAKAEETNAQNDATAKVENDRRDAEYQVKLKEVADVLAYNEGVRKRNEEALAAVTERNKKAQEEYAKAKAEYDKAFASASVTKEENATAKAEYEKKLAEYTKAKAEYDKKLAEYTQAKAQNDKDLAEYEKLKAIFESKVNEDGHLNKAVAQDLVFKKEPHAKITSITGISSFIDTTSMSNPSLADILLKDGDYYSNKLTSDYLNSRVAFSRGEGHGYSLVASVGDTFTVNYDNLENSTFNGKKISKVTYTYRIVSTPNSQSNVNIVVYSDPTATIDVASLNEFKLKDLIIEVRPKWFYEDGKEVDMSEASGLLGFNSINNDFRLGHQEAVHLLSGLEGLEITGSSVTNHSGILTSDNSNSKRSTGSKFDATEWDVKGNPLEYYGAAAAKITGKDIVFRFVDKTLDVSRDTEDLYKGFWQTISSDVKSETLPPAPKKLTVEPPKAPTAPTPPTDKVVPNFKKPTPPTTENFTPEKEKEVPPTPTEPTHVIPVHVSPKVIAFTPETYIPITPTEKPLVKVPETLHVKVSVHPVEVKQEPKIIKDVVNTDGVSTDGSTVIKGSTQTWVLHPSLIKGGRPEVKSVEFREAFPSGFEIDKEASAKLNQHYYTVVYNENGSATIKGNAALLNAVNANPSSDYVLPDIFYVGQPTLANTTFKNTYKQVISFPNGEYVTVSNTPKITTPNVQPKKENRNLDGVDINGKAMTIGATNDYRLTWNLSQYKGAVLTANEIAKGFFFVDDFPEEAVTINEAGMTLTANGKAVEGVSHKVYQSLDELPSNLKETFTKQGIKPKGAFQVFTADNSQAFYDTYVKTGTDIVISDKMVVKDELRGTGASYENTAYQVDFGQGYVTETVKNHVPKVTPLKEDFNSKGVNIDGKSVLAGSVNHYKLTWDLDQYKDMSADKETISKGFFYVDDYPADVVTVLKDQVRIYTVDKDGKEVPVSGVSVHYYDSLSEVPANIAKALTEYGYTPKGKLQVFLADDSQAFYDTYVSNPMQVKEEVAKTGATYENTAIQVDFGKAQGKSTVHNNVPKFEAVKDVKVNGKSVDGGVIQLNEHFSYTLKGVLIPADSSEPLNQYAFRDDYDQEHDEYKGVYRVIAETDFTLNIKDKDGKVETVKIAKGDDITKYTTHKHDVENGIVTIDFTKDFYDAFDNKSEFQASVELMMTRIKDGEVYNTFDNIVNGVTVLSNKVKTTTPKPNTPTPNTPKTPTPKEGKTLPNTGEQTSIVATVLGSILGMIGLAGLKRKKD